MYNKNKKYILFYEILIFNLLFIIIKSNNMIVLAIFNSIDEHILYCDEMINYFGTSNLNVYEISENGNLNNVNFQLKMKQTIYDIYIHTSSGFCQKKILYSTSSNIVKLLIVLNNPQNLFKLFAYSNAMYIQIQSGNFDNYEHYGYMFFVKI